MPNDESWFAQLFGFEEGPYEHTQECFLVDGETLESKANGARFAIGRFSTPTLGDLREQTRHGEGGLELHHEVVGDILTLHALPENEGALFQVASQFNCLEFADPKETPEDGVTQYAFDPTQGPACSLAAAAATVYRNYFVPVNGHRGQRASRQINNLRGVQEALGDDYVSVRSGYTFSTPERLARLQSAIESTDRDWLLSKARIGLQQGVEVTFRERFVPLDERRIVSQAFCSALSCGYASGTKAQWEPLARLVLEGAYEATLRAAALDVQRNAGSGRVWLTFLGGGAFGNETQWIADAIGRALRRCAHLKLDVRLAHYREMNEAMVEGVKRARRAR